MSDPRDVAGADRAAHLDREVLRDVDPELTDADPGLDLAGGAGVVRGVREVELGRPDARGGSARCVSVADGRQVRSPIPPPKVTSGTTDAVQVTRASTIARKPVNAGAPAEQAEHEGAEAEDAEGGCESHRLVAARPVGRVVDRERRAVGREGQAADEQGGDEASATTPGHLGRPGPRCDRGGRRSVDPAGGCGHGSRGSGGGGVRGRWTRRHTPASGKRWLGNGTRLRLVSGRGDAGWSGAGGGIRSWCGGVGGRCGIRG